MNIETQEKINQPAAEALKLDLAFNFNDQKELTQNISEETKFLTDTDLLSIENQDLVDKKLGDDSLQKFNQQHLENNNFYYPDILTEKLLENDIQDLLVSGDTQHTDIIESITFNIIGGTYGNDYIIGTEKRDFIFGGDGNDFINGRGGNDVLKGGAGNDILQSYAGSDELFGEEGDDILQGDGDDIILDNQTAETFYGGRGNDYIYLDDDGVINFNEGLDKAFGGEGNDYMVNRFGHSWMDGDNGDDRIFGGIDQDDINGGNGSDYIDGGNGTDYIEGGLGLDYIDGGNGIDMVYYSYSDVGMIINLSETMWGGINAKPIDGTYADMDRIIGVEDVYGTNYNDIITGNAGDNHLIGSLGDDIIYGKGGNDLLWGGFGNDTYYLDATDSGVSRVWFFGSIWNNEATDLVYEFKTNHDKVVLSNGFTVAELDISYSNNNNDTHIIHGASQMHFYNAHLTAADFEII